MYLGGGEEWTNGAIEKKVSVAIPLAVGVVVDRIVVCVCVYMYLFVSLNSLKKIPTFIGDLST